MGLVSSVFGYSNKPMRILILGLDSVGKTTLLYKMVTGETVQTITTIVFNVEPLMHNNVNLSLWDTRPGGRMAPLLRHYYAGTKGIIFVIDSTDHEHIEESEYELRSLVHLQPACATEGSGLYEGLDWLCGELTKREEQYGYKNNEIKATEYYSYKIGIDET